MKTLPITEAICKWSPANENFAYHWSDLQMISCQWKLCLSLKRFANDLLPMKTLPITEAICKWSPANENFAYHWSDLQMISCQGKLSKRTLKRNYSTVHCSLPFKWSPGNENFPQLMYLADFAYHWSDLQMISCQGKLSKRTLKRNYSTVHCSLPFKWSPGNENFPQLMYLADFAYHWSDLQMISCQGKLSKRTLKRNYSTVHCSLPFKWSPGNENFPQLMYLADFAYHWSDLQMISCQRKLSKRTLKRNYSTVHCSLPFKWSPGNENFPQLMYLADFAYHWSDLQMISCQRKLSKRTLKRNYSTVHRSWPFKWSPGNENFPQLMYLADFAYHWSDLQMISCQRKLSKRTLKRNYSTVHRSRPFKWSPGNENFPQLMYLADFAYHWSDLQMISCQRKLSKRTLKRNYSTVHRSRPFKWSPGNENFPQLMYLADFAYHWSDLQMISCQRKLSKRTLKRNYSTVHRSRPFKWSPGNENFPQLMYLADFAYHWSDLQMISCQRKLSKRTLKRNYSTVHRSRPFKWSPGNENFPQLMYLADFAYHWSDLQMISCQRKLSKRTLKRNYSTVHRSRPFKWSPGNENFPQLMYLADFAYHWSDLQMISCQWKLSKRTLKRNYSTVHCSLPFKWSPGNENFPQLMYLADFAYHWSDLQMISCQRKLSKRTLKRNYSTVHRSRPFKWSPGNENFPQLMYLADFAYHWSDLQMISCQRKLSKRTLKRNYSTVHRSRPFKWSPGNENFPQLMYLADFAYHWSDLQMISCQRKLSKRTLKRNYSTVHRSRPFKWSPGNENFPQLMYLADFAYHWSDLQMISCQGKLSKRTLKRNYSTVHRSRPFKWSPGNENFPQLMYLADFAYHWSDLQMISCQRKLSKRTLKRNYSTVHRSRPFKWSPGNENFPQLMYLADFAYHWSDLQMISCQRKLSKRTLKRNYSTVHRSRPFKWSPGNENFPQLMYLADFAYHWSDLQMISCQWKLSKRTLKRNYSTVHCSLPFKWSPGNENFPQLMYLADFAYHWRQKVYGWQIWTFADKSSLDIIKAPGTRALQAKRFLNIKWADKTCFADN